MAKTRLRKGHPSFMAGILGQLFGMSVFYAPEPPPRGRTGRPGRRKLRRQTQPDGILTRIRSASTVGTIKALEAQASGFRHASEKTKRRWKKAARKRYAELTGESLD